MWKLSISRLTKLLPALCLACVAWLIAWHFLGLDILDSEIVTLPEQFNSRVVIGISSFGQRIFHMGPTLSNIWNQSRVPDRVIVSIPRVYRKIDKKNTVCPWWVFDCALDPVQYDESQQGMLSWFAQQTGPLINQTGPNTFEFPGPLTVVFLDKDWGAGTKLLGALTLEHDPKTIIITLDDDVVYHADTIKWLAGHLGSGMALSFACEGWDKLRSRFVAYGTGLSISTVFSPHPRVCEGWLSGWAAVAYRAGHFQPDIWFFLDSLPTGCFFNDDVWLSGYLAKTGINRVYAPGILSHVQHRRDKDLSLSTIAGSRERDGYPCARALFK